MTTPDLLIPDPPIALACGASMTGVALEIPAGLTWPEWRELGAPVLAAASGGYWWLGDWLIYAEREYATLPDGSIDSAEQAKIRQVFAEVTNLELGTIKNAKWVAGVFEPSRRRDGVSWSHHYEVASMADHGLADGLLLAAEEYDWSRDQLRAERKRLEAIDAPSTDDGPAPGVRPLRVKLRPITIDDPAVREQVTSGIRAVLTAAGLDPALLEVA